MDTHKISGEWKVKRESGAVPPGLRLTLRSPKGGWAKLGPIPIGRFRLAGSTLEHRVLPLSEQLEYRDQGNWYGRLLWGKKELGRFRLERFRS